MNARSEPIVRWGLAAVGEVLEALGVERPLLLTTARWADLRVPAAARYTGARAHAEVTGVRGAADAARDAGADALLAVGGGSAIDTAKAVSVELDLPVVSVPTTYSGAEWTPFFGVRDEAQGGKSAGTGARMEGIVYDVGLTLGLPPSDSGGTALNALAHCAEALYTARRTPAGSTEALAGARLIAASLPRVLDDGSDLDARRALLEGAMHAGSALRDGMGVAHAMGQVLGGRYGLSHGAMNAVSLPHALAFNREAAADEIARLATAMGVTDVAAWAAEQGARACPMRLRDYGVPEADLPSLAEAVAGRPASQGNPRPVTPDDALALLQSAW